MNTYLYKLDNYNPPVRNIIVSIVKSKLQWSRYNIQSDRMQRVIAIEFVYEEDAIILRLQGILPSGR